MKKYILFAHLITCTIFSTQAQSSVCIKIIDGSTSEPLVGVIAVFTDVNIGGLSNSNGVVVLDNVPDDMHDLKVTTQGYEDFFVKLKTPLADTFLVKLAVEMNEMEELVLEVTRSGRSIESIPTRVEVIDKEELGEKAVMNSSNIAVLLKESTGIQVQQTSAASGNKTIRIQGLDGRYTQLVKDGFPLYSGFSGGLSIMQIPPLDLERVEVIKGSSSTLYGGGAIAGVVNLVSRKPSLGRDIEFMIDQTSALKTTLNSFYSDQKGKLGWTLYSSANYQKAYDVDNDHFSELPETKGMSITPSLFWTPNDKSSLRATFVASTEERLGGDIQVIEEEQDTSHTYSELNSSRRLSYQLTYDYWVNDSSKFNVKNSLSYFDRGVVVPNYSFMGNQVASFSEVSYSMFNNKYEWVIGTNLYTDKFTETSNSDSLRRDYNNTTVGFFTQFNKDLGSKVVAEVGLRGDYNVNYGGFVLPRTTVLFKVNDVLSTRLGVGFGYKIPTIFIEDAERLNYRSIIPIDINSVKAERSVGLNYDVNYNKKFKSGISLSVNQLFFVTNLENTLVLENNGTVNNVVNSSSNVISRGFETNVKLGYKYFKLFTNYAFVNTNFVGLNSDNQKPLTPKHNIGTVLMYEEEDKWRIGYELYFTGGQYLSDFSKTQNYIEMGFMVMRTWETFSLYINFENFTDTRQSNYQSVSVQPHNNPSFREIWAPTEGRVINGGLVLRL